MNKTQIKKELVKCARSLAKKGLVAGGGGNISARIKNSIFIKASGASLEDATQKDFIEVDLKTLRCRDGNKKPSIEIKMHTACFKARPDIGAVVHAHPPVATGFATAGRKLCDITAEFAIVLKSDVPTVKFATPGTKKLADLVATNIRHHNALLLANHGTIAVGKDLNQALERTIAIEEAAKMCLTAEIFGKIKFLNKRAIKTLLT